MLFSLSVIKERNQPYPSWTQYNAFLVDCIWTKWEAWASCDIDCVGGTRTRTRKQQPEAQHGGTACTGEATESQYCGEKSLFDIRLNGGSKDYEGYVEIKTIYNDYSGICDKVTDLEEGDILCKMLGFSLGAEHTWQSISQDSDNSHLDDLVCTGTENCIFECQSEDLTTESSKKYQIWTEKIFLSNKVQKCNASDWLGLRCKKKLDCQWSEWSSYSNCSVGCGTGKQVRTREKTVEEQYGGLCSGSEEDTIICTLNPCPSNIIYLILIHLFYSYFTHIHATGKAFASGKGFRGLCRLPAAKQTGKSGKEKWRNLSSI